MNILIITENFYPVKEPTAKIVERFTKDVNFSSDNFFILSKGERKSRVGVSTNVINYQINAYLKFKKNHFLYNLKTFIYKSLSKLYSKIYPRDLFDSFRFYKAALPILADNKIDIIVCVSGWFSSQLAGLRLSKKYHIKMFSWYTDPFIKSVNRLNYSQSLLEKIEKKWFRQTSKIFMPENYLTEYLRNYPIFKNKFLCLELPCFFSNDELEIINSQIPNNTVLHLGSFFHKLRDPQALFRIAYELNSISDVKFVSYGSLDKRIKNKYGVNIPSNFSIKERENGQNLLKALGKASVLVVVDNSFGIQIPSKTFEYISTGKPILLLYDNELSETVRLLDKYSNTLILKQDGIDNEVIFNVVTPFILSEKINMSYKDISAVYNKYTNRYIFDRLREYINFGHID